MSVKAKRIIFTKNLKAILEGTKTETRRVMKTNAKTCPYGDVGGLLWVREGYAYIGGDKSNVAYRDTYEGEDMPEWRTPLFMPRVASRLTLEVTAVYADRLQNMTEADAIAEGAANKAAFIGLWDSINAKRGQAWESNPLVWVVKFKVVSTKGTI